MSNPMTSPTDAQVEAALVAGRSDRIQGFHYPPRYVIRDVYLSPEKQEIWSCDMSEPDAEDRFYHQCEIERERVKLTAAFSLAPAGTGNEFAEGFAQIADNYAREYDLMATDADETAEQFSLKEKADAAREIAAAIRSALLPPLPSADLPGKDAGEPTAWLGYWPGAGSVDSVTKTTHSKRIASQWRESGAEIKPLYRRASALVSQPHPEGEPPFQQRVGKWMPACFTPEVCADKLERGDRLLEETFELLQSDDYPEERVDALKAYTFARPKGEPHQEVGGVMVTLAAYCLAHGLDMHQAGEDELARIWTKIDKIRAKQAAKPTGSALPIALHPAPHKAGNEGLIEALEKIGGFKGQTLISMEHGQPYSIGANAAFEEAASIAIEALALQGTKP